MHGSVVSTRRRDRISVVDVGKAENDRNMCRVLGAIGVLGDMNELHGWSGTRLS